MSQPPEPIPVLQLQYASPAIKPSARPPLSGVLRFSGIYAGSVLPLACIGISFAGFPVGPQWQSKHIEDYAKLLLSANSAWPFFPLLLYSIVCMFLVCVNPVRFAPQFRCRLGLYTGIVLAAQYCLIVLIGVSGGRDHAVVAGMGIAAVGIIIPLILMGLLNLCFARFGTTKVWITIGCLIAGIGALASMGGIWLLRGIAGGTIALSLILSPAWALTVYLILSERAGNIARNTGAAAARRAVLIPAWLIAFAGSWALAVQQAIRAYEALPPTQSRMNCYIASAAARGHRRFVQATCTANGALVNDQLRRLKAAEIALQTLTPRLHGALRAIYNRAGPLLAATLIHPLLADVAYLVLKLPEWAATRLLRRLVPDFDALAARIYCEIQSP